MTFFDFLLFSNNFGFIFDLLRPVVFNEDSFRFDLSLLTSDIVFEILGRKAEVVLDCFVERDVSKFRLEMELIFLTD